MKERRPGLDSEFMQTNATHDIIPGRDNLDQFEKLYLKKSRSWFSPDVVQLTATDGVRFVLKDWSERPVPFRLSWCRLAATREMRVYEKLRGMNGVPQLICRLGSDGFVMEWLDARPLPGRGMRDILGLEFFEHLDRVVKDMHGHGVAHGDLRRRNILRGLDGFPRLIDFETAVHANDKPEGGRLFRAICRVDDITCLKIRARYFPESLTPEDRELLEDVPWYLTMGRFLRKEVYAPMTKKGRRKRAKRSRR